jgi:uncharacterized protein (DUF1684 family)
MLSIISKWVFVARVNGGSTASHTNAAHLGKKLQRMTHRLMPFFASNEARKAIKFRDAWI